MGVIFHVSFREEKERFIRAKYVDKEYLAELPDLKQPLSLVNHMCSINAVRQTGRICLFAFYSLSYLLCVSLIGIVGCCKKQ